MEVVNFVTKRFWQGMHRIDSGGIYCLLFTSPWYCLE